ncbi:MAG: prephenate dehydratase [Pseudomonadota bacterium]
MADDKKADPASGGKIAFQGAPGAYSELAARRHAPDLEPLPCPTFEAAFEAVHSGEAERAMLPIENSLAGRVSDIHRLLPDSGLHIIAEYFLPIEHNLIVRPEANLETIKVVRSHVMALDQCRDTIKELGLQPEVAADTAGAAKWLADYGGPEDAAIASSRAAEIYGLKIAKPNIEDADHNMTRFLEMSETPQDAAPEDAPVITSFVFQVRNIPAALYKALGGFATNGVNMTKLESYQLEGSFNATRFYADAEGHPQEQSMQLALEELSFFSSSFKILGVYKAARGRES